MRIRKNAKLSPLLFSSSSCLQGGSVPLETHVCQLNQSPWDVIPFDSDSIQFQLDHSFAAGNNNGSAENSFGAVESVASMMDADKTSYHSTLVVDVAPINIDATTNMTNPCQFNDKGWPCKNEVRQGQSFCEQHLSYSLLTAHHHTSKKPQAQAQPSAPGTRRGKPRGAAGKKAAAGAGASSNPYEFYYYSGFGPLWGKRRGDRNGGEGSKSSSVGVENSTMVESENGVGGADDGINDNVASVEVGPSVSEMEHEGIIDYVDDDEEEEGEEEGVDDSGKKRMRKPVKARSLKSLM
ncbi:hypothetical protein JHK86_017807 [Glycine max]|nr:hypothetical protein JHK86_017807 [Glycine max]